MIDTETPAVEKTERQLMLEAFQAGVAYGRYRGNPNKVLHQTTRKAAKSEFTYWYEMNYE